jgi:hypothetical protein
MDDTTVAAQPRRWWVRALTMLLMAAAFHLAATVLLGLALLQLVLFLATDTPNDRVRGFGTGVGRYLAQIADFVTFVTEEAPFPFSDWPSDLPVAGR